MTVKLISLDYNPPKCETSLDTFPVILSSSPEAEVCLEEHSVSPLHCRIDWSEGRLVVRDLGSLHGTFLHGARITEAILMPGDELAVGTLSFYVQALPGRGTPSEAGQIAEH